MLIVRAATESGFTQIPNATLRDKTLSWKARGILGYLLSHREGFEIHSDSIVDQGPSGTKGNSRDAVRSGLRELEAAGYLRRSRLRDEQGSWKGVVYTVFDRPQPGTSTTPPGTDVPAPGGPAPKTDLQVTPQTDNPPQDEPSTDTPETDNPSTSTRTPALQEDQTPSLREGDPRAHTHTREDTPATGELDLGLDTPPPAADAGTKQAKAKRPPKGYAPFVAEATAIIDPWWKAQDVKPTNYPRVRSAVVACLKANWAADKIPAALTECGASGYAITHTSLETALNRLNRPAAMQGRKPFTAYQDPPDNSGYGSLKDYLRGLEAQSS